MDIKSNLSPDNFRQRHLIFLDIESTGLSVQKHEIIEIGALRVSPKKPFKILGELQIKVKPQNLKSADSDALKLVRFSEEEWKDSLGINEALGKLDDFSQNGILVGFNVSYDWAILDKTYYSLGRLDPFYYHRLDIMSMAYLKLYSKRSINRFSLGKVCKYLKIKRITEHRSLDDARVTYEVFKKLMNI